MYEGRKHVCVEGDHVLNIFSFSKAYGMMGWRIGYVRSLTPLRDGLSNSQIWIKHLMLP